MADQDEFFDGLEALLRTTSRSSHVQRFDGAPIHQVDLVVELQKVTRVVNEHCRNVLMSGQGQWAEVAELLHAAAKACANEVLIEQERPGPAAEGDAEDRGAGPQ